MLSFNGPRALGRITASHLFSKTARYEGRGAVFTGILTVLHKGVLVAVGTLDCGFVVSTDEVEGQIVR